MATPTFRVIPQADRSFSVELTTGDRIKTIPGFRSEHEASAWVVQTGRMLQMANPLHALPPRHKGIH